MGRVRAVIRWFSRAPRNARRRLPRIGPSTGKSLRRLAEAETTLEDLLHRLDDSLVPADWIDQARYTAAGTARELRALAGRLDSVQRAMVHAPSDELAGGLRQLRGQLNEGVAGYRKLIAAAGRALAASTPARSMNELTEATDHLAGIGQAIRDSQGKLP